MTEPKKKNYKSLGQMLKNGDFETLLNDLQEMQKNDDFKNFIKTTEKNPISEFDDLLFYFPQYACKTTEDSEGKITLTDELQPKALEFLEFCLKNGANPNAYMRNGENSFLKACESKSVEVLDYLINNAHVEINIKHGDGMGNNALFYATMAEATEVMEYLVKKCGFDVNHKNFLSNNETCLHYACGHGKEKSFEKLLELGASPIITDSYGCKPVEMIMAGYDEETIEEFDQNDPEDVAELKKWKSFYEKALKITEQFIEENKPLRKLKF